MVVQQFCQSRSRRCRRRRSTVLLQHLITYNTRSLGCSGPLPLTPVSGRKPYEPFWGPSASSSVGAYKSTLYKGQLETLNLEIKMATIVPKWALVKFLVLISLNFEFESLSSQKWLIYGNLWSFRYVSQTPKSVHY